MHAQAEGRGEGLSIKTFDKHFPVQRLRDEEGDTTVVVRKPLFWENGFDICFDPSSKVGSQGCARARGHCATCAAAAWGSPGHCFVQWQHMQWTSVAPPC